MTSVPVAGRRGRRGDRCRPALVGWSYGAAPAVHWAADNPDRVVGVVVVDGAVPWGLTGEENREAIRRVFRRMLGLTAAMSADEHAAVGIEINEICAAIEPVLDRLTCPVRYVFATGANLGGGQEEMRASVGPVLRRKPNLRVNAKAASNRTQIVRKDFRAIAGAVRETAAAQDQEAS